MKENLHWIILLAGLLAVVVSSLVSKFKAKRRIRLMPTLGDMTTLKESEKAKPVNFGFEAESSEKDIPSQAPQQMPITSLPEATSIQKEPDYVVIGVMAKKSDSFVGYDLLQALLTARLRFGDNHIFHFHKYPHGQGAILFSVANQEDGGAFDIHNMGACVTKGLTVFMDLNATADPRQILYKMLDVTQKLSEDLGGVVIDKKRKILTQETLTELIKRVEAKEQEMEGVV